MSNALDRVIRLAETIRIVPKKADPVTRELYGYVTPILDDVAARRILYAVALRFGIQRYEMQAHMSEALRIMNDRVVS